MDSSARSCSTDQYINVIICFYPPHAASLKHLLRWLLLCLGEIMLSSRQLDVLLVAHAFCLSPFLSVSIASSFCLSPIPVLCFPHHQHPPSLGRVGLQPSGWEERPSGPRLSLLILLFSTTKTKTRWLLNIRAEWFSQPCLCCCFQTSIQLLDAHTFQ